MSTPDDPRLDALLREAAPSDVPDGLAGRVVAAARARRSRRRLVRVVAAAAAALAIAGAALLLHGGAGSGPAHLAVKQAKALVQPPQPDGAPAGAPRASFAAVLPSDGTAAHRVIVGRLDSQFVVFARPNVPAAEAPGAAPRALAATVGWVTPD